tara:strand:- start:477 stop:599 length:123 start_codon:yes stop_codon:yes gene_type:complete
MGDGGICLNCGSIFNEIENKENYSEDAGSETIEIEAEEIN